VYEGVYILLEEPSRVSHSRLRLPPFRGSLSSHPPLRPPSAGLVPVTRSSRAGASLPPRATSPPTIAKRRGKHRGTIFDYADLGVSDIGGGIKHRGLAALVRGRGGGGRGLDVRAADRNFYPREIEYTRVVYGFTPRGDSRGPRMVFYIPTISLSLSLSLSLLPFLSRAARLRGARRRGSAVCAEFESSCNKIRALCDGLRYPARARVRPAHIYSGKKVKCIQVGYGV
jgi:hypothetical protein